MKLKPIVLATLAASYAVGVASASEASSTNVIQASQLKQVSISADQLKQSQVDRAPSSVKRQGAAHQVNRQIRRASSADKFKPEANITGLQVYIVRLNDLPVATYDGRISGLAATNPAAVKKAALTSKVNPVATNSKLMGANAVNKTAINDYQSYLHVKQDEMVSASAKIGVQVDVRQRYTTAINAISVEMTQEQAKTMARLPHVKHIERSINYELHTDVGPQHIGAGAAWGGNLGDGVEYKGEGIVVGIIDTGINSDHISFADIGGDGYDHTNPLGSGVYLGDCAKAEFATMCNDKLIGIRSYPGITDDYDDDEYQAPGWEYWMTREWIRPANGEDYNGHGSHTASTVAGNVVYDAPLQFASYGNGDGQDTGFTFSQVSGVAPHANIIAYQVCGLNACPGEVMLAGIEDAIGDGVDAINFSIGGMEQLPWNSSIEMAFLSAREAGISVAVSAGNSGDNGYGSENMGSSDHTSPWLLSVAATNHGRMVDVTDNVMNGFSGGDPLMAPPSEMTGTGLSTPYTANIVLAPIDNVSCDLPVAAGTYTMGEIVVCKRSDQPRAAKSDNVASGGAGGFVLYNEAEWGDGSNVVNDIYSLPMMHIDAYTAFYDYWRGGTPLLDWLATGSGHMATINGTSISSSIDPDQVDMLAPFSSRGPSQTYSGHLVPGISAPGVDVYAAWSDEHPFDAQPQSQDWNIISGTSMASPHIAGAMALIRQARPEWTATQLQSAIQMTALQTVKYDSGWVNGVAEAGISRAGHGLINIPNAINSGLLMDETADNFMWANPENGGDVKSLNLPELVNSHCRKTCSWVRTVTATKDSTWNVTAATGEYSVELSVVPMQFTLKAGESQSIVVTGAILDSQSIYANAEQEVWGQVTLTPTDEAIPTAHWPVSMTYDHGDLPENLNVTAHRDEGSFALKGLTVPAITETIIRTYQPISSVVEEFYIPQDENNAIPYVDNDVETGAKVFWLDVPAGASRIMAEVVAELGTDINDPNYMWMAGDLDVYIGIDANNDGEIDMANEAICMSNSAELMDFCNINYPDEGSYWVVFHNYKSWADWALPAAPTDGYQVAMAVVSGDEATDISVTSKATSTDGTQTLDVDVNWNLTGFAKGDVIYTAFDLGTDPLNAGNLGFVPVKIMRGEDDVSLITSQTQARAGDIIDVKVKVLENNSGADRTFDLTTTLPDGYTIVPGSVKGFASVADMVSVDGQTITVSGSQVDSTDWYPEYVATTNVKDDPNYVYDAMCRMKSYDDYMGNSTDGGYIDMQSVFGFSHMPGLGGAWDNRTRLPFNMFGYDKYALYNNLEHSAHTAFTISSQGYVQIDDMPNFWNQAEKFPKAGFPNQMIGVFHKGVFFGNSLATPEPMYPWDDGGITVAYDDDPNDRMLLIEWDNATTDQYIGQDENWEAMYDYTYHGDSYDFELMMKMDVKFDEGQYELIMAYDNINFEGTSGELEATGSIGVHGYTGPNSMFGPVFGYKGTSYAFHDSVWYMTPEEEALDNKVKSGLVVCYDYRGPESSQFELNFQVRIAETATGTELPITFTSSVEGMGDSMLVQNITVPGNITVGVINDQSIDENTTLEGLMVPYADNDSNVNVISVTGANISAVITEHTPGSTIDIVPDVNFHGETEVTVTVADAVYANDQSSTTFMLTVMSDGVEFGCTDSTATNYDANATDDDGSCTLPVAEAPVPEVKSDGGGSMGIALILLSLLSIGRRKMK